MAIDGDYAFLGGDRVSESEPFGFIQLFVKTRISEFKDLEICRRAGSANWLRKVSVCDKAIPINQEA